MPIGKTNDAISLPAMYCPDVPVAGIDKDDIIYRITMYSSVEE
jgi:hypothetical protein